MEIDKVQVLQDLKGIMEDHQRKLNLDLSSYVEQIPMRCRSVAERGVCFELRASDSDGASVEDLLVAELPALPKTSSNDVAAVMTRRSVTYNLAKEASERRQVQSKASTLSSLRDTIRCREYLLKLVESWPFETFFAGVILTNSIFIGVTIQLEAQEQPAHDPTAIFVVQLVYSLLFTLELLLRLTAVGCRRYFCGSQIAWNWFDTFIVLSALYELVTELLATGLDSESDSVASTAGSNLRIFRILRLTRLTRVLRVVRLIRFVRPLQTLVNSIFHTLKALAWALVLLSVINYMFAILFTDMVNGTSSSELVDPRAMEGLKMRFGNLQVSTLTLFMSITGGLSWVEATDLLMNIGWLWVYAFCSFVSFSTFAVLNVMTGVFCSSAIQGAQKDQEVAVQNLLLDTDHMKSLLQKLFLQLDDSGRGKLTLADFERHFNDDEVRAAFETLELKATDAWTLFQSIDNDENFEVTMEEFLSSCVQLRGPAKAIDLFALRTQMSKVRDQLKKISKSLQLPKPVLGTRVSL